MITKSKLCFLLTLSVLLPIQSSCAGTEAELKNFAFDGFDSALGYDITKSNATNTVLKRFGKPLSTKCRIEHGVEPGEYVEYIHWIYEGIEIEMMGPVLLTDRWLESITLTNQSIPLKYGLAIGKSKDEFIKILGAARSDSTERIIKYITDYAITENNIDSGVDVYLTLYVNDGGNIEKIVWGYKGD